MIALNEICREALQSGFARVVFREAARWRENALAMERRYRGRFACGSPQRVGLGSGTKFRRRIWLFQVKFFADSAGLLGHDSHHGHSRGHCNRDSRAAIRRDTTPYHQNLILFILSLDSLGKAAGSSCRRIAVLSALIPTHAEERAICRLGSQLSLSSAPVPPKKFPISFQPASLSNSRSRNAFTTRLAS